MKEENSDLKPKEIAKMKRDIKGKRFVLEKDNYIPRKVVDMIGDEKVVTKEEKNFVIDLTKGDEINENID